MIQLDAYALDGRLTASREIDGGALVATLRQIAGRPIEALQAHVLGQVSIVRVDLGRAGYAVLEHVA